MRPEEAERELDEETGAEVRLANFGESPSKRSSRGPGPDGLPLTAPAPDDGEDDYRYVDWGADL